MADNPGMARTDEAWLRTLVEGMPQMIWRSLSGGHWTWASPQWQRFTGQADGAAAEYGWLDAVHPDDRELAMENWRRAPERGEFHADLRIRDREGRYRWFQTRGEPVRDGTGAITEWIGTSTDVDDLRQLQSEQKVLVAELQHRTRNLIAVVHSICVQTLQRAISLEDFRDRFEDRLSALSRVQGLLSTSEHEPITIGRLIEMELRALGGGRVERQVAMTGPETVVRNSTAQTLALAVHELSTNALKYGALSSPSGRLAVAWHEHARGGQPWLQLSWAESGGSTSAEEAGKGRGYGRVLIEQALPRQLGAQSRMTFVHGGMHCVIDMPLKHFRLEDLDGV